jgi:hypothetical protein
MTHRFFEASPSLRARIAGVSYLLAILTAVFGEFLVRGRLGFALGLIAVSRYIAVTLILYGIFTPVNRSLSLLAASFSLVGLVLEALQWQPRGVNVAVLFHGFYGPKSTFLPRILGTLMAFAGLVWLIYLSPPLANYFSPYNTAAGILGEGLPMLWLLVFGLNVPRWKQAGTAGLDMH